MRSVAQGKQNGFGLRWACRAVLDRVTPQGQRPVIGAALLGIIEQCGHESSRKVRYHERS